MFFVLFFLLERFASQLTVILIEILLMFAFVLQLSLLERPHQ